MAWLAGLWSAGRLLHTPVLINKAVPIDINMSVKEYNKISKYKHLEIETEIMWPLKTTSVLLIVKTLGKIKEIRYL